MMNPFKIFSRREQKAEVSTLRTVNPTFRHLNPPPVSVLEETRLDDTIIPLVTATSKPAPRFEIESIAPENVLGIARCSTCYADLELVCPNGHGGADTILADLVRSKESAPPVDEIRQIRAGKEAKLPLRCACGAVVPRKRGRAPAIVQCEECKAKKGLAA